MTSLKEKFLRIVGKEPETLDELAHGVIKVIESQTTKIWNGNIYLQHPIKVLGFSWDIWYRSTVSNSHSAPEGKQTNWGGYKTDIPTSYPGWEGRVWIRYAPIKNGHHISSTPFCNTLTHPGTGGSGTYDGPWSALSAACCINN